MLQIGDSVRVLEPFNISFPHVYIITNVNEETGAFQILDGLEFDEKFLEKVE